MKPPNEYDQLAIEYTRTLVDELATLPRHGANPDHGELSAPVLDKLRAARTVGPRGERLAWAISDASDGQGWIGTHMKFLPSVWERSETVDELRVMLDELRQHLAGAEGAR